MDNEFYLDQRATGPTIWIAAPGIDAECALCHEAIMAGETVCEGVDDELLHFVCVSFQEEN